MATLLGGNCLTLAKLVVSGGDVLKQTPQNALDLAAANFQKVPGMAAWKIQKSEVRHICEM